MGDRSQPGRVRDAIVSYLESRDTACSLAEIQQGVEHQLGVPTPASSIRSYLRLQEGSVFTRVSRGQYRLALPEEEGPSENLVERARYGASVLVQGNCFEWLRRRDPQSIQAVVTDPPYGLMEYSAEQQAKLRSGYGGVWRIPPAFDGHRRSPLPRFTVLKDQDLRALELFFRRWAQLLLPVLVPGAHVFVASNPLLSYLVSNALAREGFERRGEIVRLTMTMRGGDRPKNAHQEFPLVTVMPRSMWEPWLLFRKPIEDRVQDNLRKWKTGALRRISEDRPFSDVIQSLPTRPAERRLAPHPSLKPQSFLRQIVRASLPLGEGIVLDPFAGSGSTLAAAEAVGYASVGVEMDGLYADMAVGAIPALAALSWPQPEGGKSSSRVASPARRD